MKKIPLSPLDLGMVIAFVVVGLLGGGAWWFLSGQLQAAIDDVAEANRDFGTYSVNQGIVVSESNEKTLQDNIDLIKAHLDPLIQNKLLSKEDELSQANQQDPVTWKHKLAHEVDRLTTEAKLHAVVLPPGFYFSFSRYVSENPGDEQTLVLNKQLLGVGKITDILTNASISSILAIRRTYEEDDHSAAASSNGGKLEGDRLNGFAETGGNGAYLAYPFEFEFECTTENLRKVMDDLVQSPYVLIVRSVVIQNHKMSSPLLTDLDQMAGTNQSPSVTGSSPGEVAATAPTMGPQFLFTNAPLKVRLRIDMIEWKASTAVDDSTTPARTGRRSSSSQGNP